MKLWPSVIYPWICWAQAWVQLWSYSLTVTVTILIFEFWRPGFYRSWQHPTLAAWYLPSNFRGNQFWRIPICFDLRLESSLSTAQLLHIITIRASAPVLQDTLLIESLGFFQMLLLGSTSWYHWYPLAIRYNHGTSVAQPWQLVFLFAAPGWCIHHPPTPVASDRSIPWNCRWREGAWGDTFGVGHT